MSVLEKLHNMDEAAKSLRTILPPDDDTDVQVHLWSRRITLQWYSDSDQSDDRNRAGALEFLGGWMRRFAKLGEVTKVYGEYDVYVEVRLECGWSLRAEVSANAVCQYRPVLDESGAPVLIPKVKVQTTSTETTEMIPQIERVCPPSFLAGVQL